MPDWRPVDASLYAKLQSFAWGAKLSLSARDPRLLPAYTGALSLVVLAGSILARSAAVRWVFGRSSETGEESGSTETSELNLVSDGNWIRRYTTARGGLSIYAFSAARFACVLTLFVIHAASFAYGNERADAGLWGSLNVSRLKAENLLIILSCVTYAYASLLALATVTMSSFFARPASTHLNIILLVGLGVHGFRNLWPLMTYTLIPADAAEGPILWVKIALLAISGLAVPLLVPRKYMPRGAQGSPNTHNPEETASILSLALYNFMWPTVYAASRGPKNSLNVLPPLASYDEAKYLVARSFKHLDTFSGAPRRHLFFSFVRVFRWEYVQMFLIIILHVCAKFLSPIGINRLLKYLETHGDGAIVRPWVWISLLFLSPLLVTIFLQRYIFLGTSCLIRGQAMMTQLIFEHALRIRTNNATDEGKGKQPADSGSPAAREKANSDSIIIGKINTLVGADLDNIGSARDFLQFLVFLPLQTGLSIYFLYKLLGWSAFVGFAIMLICFPAPGLVVRAMQNLQKKVMAATDARVHQVTEVLNVLRMVKLFGWEAKISQRIGEKREEELKWLKLRELANLVNYFINATIPILVMIGSYGSFTAFQHGQLTPSVVFSTMTVFEMLREQLQMAVFWIPLLTQGKVSLDRVTDFLQNTELIDLFSGNEATIAMSELLPDRDVLGFKNVTFSWSRNASASDGAQTPSRRSFTLCVNGELVFKQGAINIIIGPTGSGKTSMLMALLGEMHFVPMELGWFNLPRGGGVAYAAQESWVLNRTIKDNIVFGASYDEDRYKRVVYQCGLEPDISLFAAGDETEVGEKGLTLSGGQKARITLARAVYSSAEVVLLDDVLAALDVHTSKWIVEKCLKGDLLQGRTVLLVTHNLALASPVAEFVVTLGSDGRIISHGSVADAIARNETMQAVLGKQAESLAQTKEAPDSEAGVSSAEAKGKNDGKLIVTEEVASGHVSWAALNLLFSSLGGSHSVLFWISFVAPMFFGQIFYAGESWWLGQWAEQYDFHAPSDVNISFYLTILVLITVGNLVTELSSLTVFLFGLIRAVRKIHQLLIQSVVGTTLRWLDTTPTSRIIARCTQDIRSVDGPVANELKALVDMTTNMIVRIAAVGIIAPAFLLPSMALAVVGSYVSNLYMAAELPVKRLQSNAKAPILGHFGAAIAGLVSVRAYGAQDAFRAELMDSINHYTLPARVAFNLNRWIGVRIDVLGGVFAAGLGAYLVYVPNSHALPSNTGFALSMAVGFSGMIIYFVRIANMFEVDSNSLERIHAYIGIEKELEPVREKIPPASWPTSGELQVERLFARYSPGGPCVLNDVSFRVKSGERVGIVGRTGSGKSSLTLSLLRCIFTEGSILYDGIDTACLSLDTLRSNITIIPQVPDLLSGTLRENLDPFQEHDDATLNFALRSAGLFSLQEETDDARLTLDSRISPGGQNLSMGQRQILALARALVRGSKLLILDEATSSIDYNTDAIIQSSLRNELSDDVTVLTVAHRLQTIMDADKIMVLDTGRLVEFDKPSILLKKESGYFRALVDESEDRDTLYAMVDAQSGV